jgi:hypothetical protein
VLGIGAGAWLVWGVSRTRETHAGAPAPAASRPLAAVPGQGERLFPAELDDNLQRLDPAKDGWDSEVLSDAITKDLKELAKKLHRPTDVDLEHVGFIAHPDFAATPLRPASLRPVFRGTQVTVYRPADDLGRAAIVHRGPAGLVDALRELLAPYPAEADLRVLVKLAGIHLATDAADTEVLLQVSGLAREGRLQQNSAWRARFDLPATGEHPRLLEVRVAQHEETAGLADGRTLFADATAAVLGAEPSFREQHALGSGHWSATLDVAFGSHLLGHTGLAVGDVNGDGLDDVYVTQGGGLPNRLYVQRPDGTVDDVSAAAGVDYLDASNSALILDFDNDGDQDLVVAAGPLIFHSNDGTGRFTVEAVLPVMFAYSLAAGDYDGDGDLDLYACLYGAPWDDPPTPYHDANNGMPDVLLRNDGGFRFTDVTAESGIDENNHRFSFAAAWADYDDDGDLDLYVANDFGRKNLYRNDGGRFTDVAAAVGVEDIGAGMSVAWGDYNNDGRLDLYVGNMWSSAGKRTSDQERFHESANPEVRGQFRRHSRGNSLFENAGDGTFRDVSEAAGVTMGRWAWASKFADIDNDGLEDIYVVNGYVTNDDPHDL